MLLVTEYYWSDKIKEDKEGEACGTYGGEEKYRVGGDEGKAPFERPKYGYEG
jgi:hypothetical protein